jgi:hypothetical protein
LACAALIGCGDDGGNNNNGGDANNGPDAKVFRDAPPTNNATVMISGVASERSQSGATLLPGVTIVAYRNADENTPIAMTTSDAQGNYTLVIQTMGESVDGFLKATKQGYKETYLYPPYPIAMDFNMASVIMVTQNTYDTLSNITASNQQPGKGLIGLVVTDGTNPVAGATVACTPPTPLPARYNQVVGTLVLPTANAMSTYDDGIAYLFNVAPEQVTVSAEKTGMTFASHAVKAWPDQLTTTVIVP